MTLVREVGVKKRNLKDLVKSLTTDGDYQYQGISTLHILSVVTGRNIQTFCPITNLATEDYTRIIRGQSIKTSKNLIYILFTLLGYRKGSDFVMNHYVSLAKKRFK